MKRWLQILTILLLSLPLISWSQASAPDKVLPRVHHADPLSAKHENCFHKVVLPFNNRQQAAIDYQQALQALAAGAIMQAETKLSDALKQEPQHISARQLLASILIHRLELAKAQRLLEDGVKLQPQETAFNLMLARVYNEQHQPARGITLLENLNVPTALRSRVDAMLAALYQRVARYDDAIVLYRHLLQQDPRQAMWWVGLAMSLEGSHRPTNALTAYRQARSAKPGSRTVETFIAARIAALSETDKQDKQS